MPDRPLLPTSYLTFLDALAQKVDFSGSPTADRIIAYCGELANLRIDFERMDDLLFAWWWMIDGFEESDSARGLMRKKFLVTYTEDNAVVRVHAYHERVFQLTNAVLTPAISEHKVNIIDVVTQNLRENRHLSLLRHLEILTVNKPPAIRAALERRNEFVHRIPTREWRSLASWAQLQEWLDFDDDTEVFRSKDPPHVQLEADNLKRKWGWVIDFLKALMGELDDFKERFCALLYAAYSGSVEE